MTQEAILQENLTTLSALTAALSKASGKLLGRSANSIMYLSGVDMGKQEGLKLDHSDDLEQAIAIALRAELRGWGIKLWKDADQDDILVQEGDSHWAWVVFHECPVRQVCLAHDMEMGDSLCHLSHGYLAGVLSEVLGKKVDLILEHAGTNACKKRLRIK